jgi:hypothetical protein
MGTDKNSFSKEICPYPNRNSKGHTRTSVLTVKICQPSHEFTFGVGISFIPYPLLQTPVV